MGLLREQQGDRLSELVEALSLFDEDGDGCSVLEELATVFRSLGKNPNEGDVSHHVLSIVDVDGIEKAEFGGFLNQMNREIREIDAEEELREVFNVFDRDQSGYISANELRNVMMSLGEKLTEEEAQQMIREADLDGDGRVNYQDFAQMMSNI